VWEGNQILQMKSVKSVNTIRGYTILAVGLLWLLGMVIVRAWCVHAKRADRAAGYDDEGGRAARD